MTIANGQRSFVQAACFMMGAVILLSGCVASPAQPDGSELAISLPYDPYSVDLEALNTQAQAHCDAYGLRAVFEDETIDNQSVRWRYRHYVCVGE